jgi:hypothetical protein
MERKWIEFDRLYDLGFYAGPHKQWTVWEIIWSWEQLQQFQKLFGIYHSDNFYEVVDLFGAGSVLSIGGLAGEIVEPETMLELRYPGGQMMERSWQYLWKPSALSKQLIDSEINTFQRSPESFLTADTAIFKTLVPMKATNYGVTEVAVTEIPLHKLPGMIKPALTLRLEKDF